jgi:hypothetical protein
MGRAHYWSLSCASSVHGRFGVLTWGYNMAVIYCEMWRDIVWEIFSGDHRSYSEDGSTTLPRNIRNDLQDYITSRPMRH